MKTYKIKTIRLLVLVFFAICFSNQHADAQVLKGVEKLVNRGIKTSTKFFRKKVKRAFKFKAGKNLEDKVVKKDFEVIGFEPAWTITDANTPYKGHYHNLFSTLVLGTYDLNPLTGEARDEAFKLACVKHDIVSSALENNIDLKFLYSVTYYGDFGKDQQEKRDYYRSFLENTDTQAEMLKRVNNIVDTLDINGIFLDFQYIPASHREEFIEFIRLVRDKAKDSPRDNYLIYLRLPSHEEETYFSAETIKELGKFVDKFILRGYDNYKQPKAGAVAPIIVKNGTQTDSILFNNKGISQLVSQYDNSGLPKKDLIVELPLTATAWEKLDDNVWRPKGENRLSYSRLMKNEKPKNKSYAKDTSFVMASNLEGDTYFFYNDSTTISKKYNWIYQQELGGVGLNALGYINKNDKGLWGALGAVFAESPVSLGPYVFGYLLFFLFAGLFYTLWRYWEVGNYMNKYRFTYWYYITTIIAVIGLFFALVFWLPKPESKGALPTIILLSALIIFPAFRNYFKILKRWVNI